MLRLIAAGALTILTLAGCSGPATKPAGSGAVGPGRATNASDPSAGNPASSAAPARATTTRVPRPSHVVVVMLENRSYSDIVGQAAAPYLNSLARSGALFTHSYAVTHPSQPNYLALFSGSTHGVTADSCPHAFTSANIASQLRASRHSFVGYSEGLPRTGFTGCTHGLYARKHVPWVNFAALPASTNRPFTSFPAAYSKLPSLSFVIPDLDHDMHNGTIAQGDQWIRTHLGGYARWAKTHNSLLIVTWDEDDHSQHNRIPTIITGAHVRPGRYSEHLTHYRLLRTIDAMYGLKALHEAASTTPVTDIWS